MASRIFRALDEYNNDVLIEDAVQDKIIKYFCPVCKNEVIVKASNSKYKCKHFRHKAECIYKQKNDISEWHRNWQNQFPKENQEVYMSGDDGEIHRADVCINNTVFEFQNSDITEDEIIKRNNFYTEKHKLIWIFNEHNKIKNVKYLFEKERIEKNNIGLVYLYWKKEHSIFNAFVNNPSDVKVYIEEIFENEVVLIKCKEICRDYILRYLTPNAITQKKFIEDIYERFGLEK